MAGRMFKTLAEALLAKTKIDTETGCWNWLASKNNKGYGRIRFRSEEQLAHRASYEVHRGKIPNGVCACHTCDNRGCINPDHIFLGTSKENTADMIAKGRIRTPGAKGVRNAGAKLDETTVLAIRASVDSSVQALSERFGMSKSQIRNIRYGRHWTHV